MSSILLENGQIFFRNELVRGSILIKGEKIDRIASSPLRGRSADRKIDCEGCVVLPGMVDLHEHLRDFEESHKEDYLSGTLAAAHGGITTVFDMPNKIPALNSASRLEEATKRIAERSIVDVKPYVLLEAHNDFEYPFWKAYLGQSTNVASPISIETICKLLRRENRFLAVHCEDPSPVGQTDHDSSHTEVEGIRQVLGCLHPGAKPGGSHLHLAHVSTRQSVALIMKESAHPRLTAEVTPHHLFLSEKDAERLGKNLGKVSPPLRPREDVMAMWEAFKRGDVGIFATDHAPHTLEEKVELGLAGFPNSEVALPLLLGAVSRGILSINRLVQAFSYLPSQVVGLSDRGTVEEGLRADLVVVNWEKWRVDPQENLLSKAGWSPFDSEVLHAKVQVSICGGRIVFEDL